MDGEAELFLDDRDTATSAESAETEPSERRDPLATIAAMLAHDVNNVLTAIIGHGTALARHHGGASVARDAEAIVRLAERGAITLRRLLSLTAGATAPRERQSIGARVRELEPILRRIAAPYVSLDMEVFAGPDDALLSNDAVDRVLLNLVANACAAMASGGTLGVATRAVVLDAAEAARLGVPAQRYVGLLVADNGDGMSAADSARAFEPGYTTKARPARGLGLASVRRLAHEHGGYVTLASEPGCGTEIFVAFPASDP